MEFARIARRTLGASAVTLTAAVALLAMTAPASAHTPVVKAECKDEKAVLSVTLTKYAGGNSNTVKIKDGDETLKDTKFGESYKETFTRSGDVPHVFTVAVKASDNSQYSFTKEYKTPACVTPTSSTTTTTTTTTTTSATTTTTEPTTETTTTTTAPSETTTTTEPTTETTTTTTAPSETTTTTTPSLFLPTTTTTKAIVPVGNETELPNTGASIAIPLAVGLGLLGAGGVALLALRRRRAAE